MMTKEENLQKEIDSLKASLKRAMDIIHDMSLVKNLIHYSPHMFDPRMSAEDIQVIVDANTPHDIIEQAGLLNMKSRSVGIIAPAEKEQAFLEYLEFAK